MSKKCVCGREMVLKSWKHMWVCTRCGRTKPEAEIPTNADHIRSMSDEELAEFLCGVYDDENCGAYQDECGKFICGTTIFDYDQYKIADWLKQPYEEG